MNAICHYCKDDNLAQQSNNLCVECFNKIIAHYRKRKPAQSHYLETLLIGLKPEPLGKLYIKALYMCHLDYCQDIIQFVEKGREDGQSRIKTVKDRLPGNSREDTNRRGGSPYLGNNSRHLGRNQTQKRDLIPANYKVKSALPC